jgi:hypothetical protein
LKDSFERVYSSGSDFMAPEIFATRLTSKRNASKVTLCL